MGDARVRLIGSFAAAAVLLQCGVPGVASAATWWPSATVFSRPARIGLAASGAGSFLLVDGRDASEAASCAAGAPAFTLGGPEPTQRGTAYGTGGSAIPGSPSFQPDGRSLALFLAPVLHSEYVERLEGPSSAPAAISREFPPGGGNVIASTNVFVVQPGVSSTTGPRGDVAVVDVPSTGPGISTTRRLAGSTEWRTETISGWGSPTALAVDGLGDTTVLANTFALTGSPPVETASAYFAPPGAPFTPLAVPGNYFTAIASDAAGRSAIAGYTSSGPDGPGLYLSRRESPYGAFGAPVLLSSLSRDPRPQLAYDAHGVLSVAWSEGSDVAVTTAEPGEPVQAPQVLSAPGAAAASDEQLSVDAAGETILTWIGGPHEEFAGPGLHGVAAPVFAAVRGSASESFQAVQELSSSALYSEGLYPYRVSPEARAVAAISSGRAMVAWLEEGASGPAVKTALYAAQPGCASPPPPAPPMSMVIPRTPSLASLAQSAKIWREGDLLAEVSAGQSTKKLPVGTTFTFTLNEAASVTFRFTEPAGGRRVGKRCVAQTRENKRERRCTRTAIAGTMTFSAHAATNKLRFDGLISRHKRLKPGSYVLLVTATAAGKRSATRTLHFTIA